MRHRDSVLGLETFGDERSVARLGVTLDAEQGGRSIARQLRHQGAEVDAVEDLAHVAPPVLGREDISRALSNPLPGVLRVLKATQLSGGRELLVVAVPDPGFGERRLETGRVRPRVLGAANPAPLAHVHHETDLGIEESLEEGGQRPSVHPDRCGSPHGESR